MDATFPTRCGILTAVLLLAGSLAGAHPDPRHSLQAIDEHLATSPQDPQLFLNRADVYLGIGDTARAQQAIDQAEKLNPQTPGLGYYQARVLLGLRRLDQTDNARKRLEKFLVAEPTHADAWRLLARLRSDAGDFDAAIDAAAQVLLTDSKQLSPDDFTKAAALHLHRHQSGDDEQAITLLNQGLARFGCLKGLHYMAGDIEARLGRHDAALQRLAALSARFRPQVEFEVKRAEILAAAGRRAESARAYDNAVAILDSYSRERQASEIFRQTRASYVALRDASSSDR